MSSGTISLGPLYPGSWRTPVSSSTFLPAIGNTVGDVIVTQDNQDIYVWNGANWALAVSGGGGGGITALTGDVSASGSGSVVATVNSVGGTSAANIASGATSANAATSTDTVSTIVKRDGSGNFSAGTVTATGLLVNGNTTIVATTGTALDITSAGDSFNTIRLKGPTGPNWHINALTSGNLQIDGQLTSKIAATFIETGEVGFGTSPFASTSFSMSQFINETGLAIRGAAATTANLTEWQSSGNATLALVDYLGNISGTNLSGTNTGNVTLGTANGLSLASQVLSLGLSSSTTTGSLSSTDWNTFNSKGSGSVTSVAVTAPSYLTVTGSPITSSGTIAITGTSESANLFLASPNGSSGVLSPRAIVAADLPSLSGTYVTQSEVGAVNGVASLDSAGHVPLSQLPPTIIEYLGTWNASTNTPTLVNGTGVSGQFYIVSIGGTVNFGAGNITFNAGDWVLYNGTIWERAVQSNIIQSVNGQTGIVTINAINQLTGDVTASAASGSQSKATSLVATSNSTLTTLSSLSLPTSQLSGTISLTSQVSGVLPIANGGTGSSSIAFITRSISNVSTATSAGSTSNVDYVYLISGTTTLTLPTAVSNTNKYTVKNVGANTVTIATTSAQTIDGSSTATLPVTNTSLDLISNGTNWNVI